VSRYRLVPRGVGRGAGPGPRGQRLHFATLTAGLDRKAPWFQIKEDHQATATSVYVILRVVDNLKTILAPILPHTPKAARVPGIRRETL
jgi:hypothetical protein